MFSYYICGLGITSSFPLPEALEAEAGSDVTIRRGKVDNLPEDSDVAHHSFRASSDEICLCWKDVGAFLIKGGREIIIDAPDDIDEKILRLFLLGRVLGSLLHQRGLLVLHASAVTVDDGAVAFLGGKGYGKSTTAAAMYTFGHTLVTDDILALQVDDVALPVVFPGYPQMRLWPEAAESLGDSVETLPRLHPDFEKRARQAARGFSSTPLPLRRIYLLADGESHKIEPLRPQEAFLEVVRHSYAVKLLEATETNSRHFLQAKKLIDSVPVFRLSRPESLTGLPELVRLVKEDLVSRTENCSNTMQS
jgi:hypothetical protein